MLCYGLWRIYAWIDCTIQQITIRLQLQHAIMSTIIKLTQNSRERNKIMFSFFRFDLHMYNYTSIQIQMSSFQRKKRDIGWDHMSIFDVAVVEATLKLKLSRVYYHWINQNTTNLKMDPDYRSFEIKNVIWTLLQFVCLR